jgi:hypothetical protein
MSDKKAQLQSQALWEAQKKLRDELDARKKMNQDILYHFDDNFESSQRAERGGIASTMRFAVRFTRINFMNRRERHAFKSMVLPTRNRSHEFFSSLIANFIRANMPHTSLNHAGTTPLLAAIQEGSPHQSHTSSPTGSPRRMPGGLTAYEMKQKGLVSSGTWNINLCLDKWPELPGGVGVHAKVTGSVCMYSCAVIVLRQKVMDGCL